MTRIRDESEAGVMEDAALKIRVFGEPQPFPKKEVKKRGNRLVPVDRDYRTRKSPHTNEIIKYDFGYKRSWMNLVATTVEKFMVKNNFNPFPKNHPIAMGTLFFITQSKSNKLIFPSQPPDEDNYDYAVKNALKRTPKYKGRDGKYPNGILYYDDDQVVWRLMPSGKLWADEYNPPGVLITFIDAFEIKEEIFKYKRRE